MSLTNFPNGVGVGSQKLGIGHEMNSPTLVSLGAPIAPDIDSFIDGATGSELPDTETVTYTVSDVGVSPIDGANTTWVLDKPRNMVVTATHLSSIVACTVLITGIDIYGESMSELFTVTATGTTKTVSGLKAFKTITSIAITASADSEANTIEVGHADVLGLPFLMAMDTILLEFEDGTAPTAGTVVVADVTDPATTTTGDVRGTYDPNSACDGSAEFKVYCIPSSLTSRGQLQV